MRGFVQKKIEWTNEKLRLKDTVVRLVPESDVYLSLAVTWWSHLTHNTVNDTLNTFDARGIIAPTI